MKSQEKIINEFLNDSYHYFRGELPEEKLTESTTQPFFQSLKLAEEKERAEGITMSRVLLPLKKDRNHFKHSNQLSYQTIRTYTKGGKSIGKFKDTELATVNILKGYGEENEAPCPNCGHMGKVSSYINGCDYCGSKFKVSDFEEKIGNFSFDEDVTNKTYDAFKKGRHMSYWTLGLLGLLQILAIVLIVFYLMGRQQNAVLGNVSFVMLMGAFQISKALLRTLIVCIILFFLIFKFILPKFSQPVLGLANVTQYLSYFNSDKFIETLGFKLKAVLLAKDERKVSRFADCDLSGLKNPGEEILDCELGQITYLGAERGATEDTVSARCKVKLTVLKNGKIKRRYHNFEVLMGWRRVDPEKKGDDKQEHKDITAIRAFICPNCGRNIDVMNGGVCDCGYELDKYSLGWIFHYMEESKAHFHAYRAIKLSMVAMSLVVFALVSLILGTFQPYKKGTWLYEARVTTTMMDDAIKAVDEIPRINELSKDAKLIKETDNPGYYHATYEVDDSDQSVRDLYQYINDQDYKYLGSNYDSVENFGTTKYYKVFKEDKAGDIYLLLEIHEEGNHVTTTYTVTDELNQDFY